MEWVPPILVKELRQAMRNRLVIWILMLLLGAFVFGSGFLMSMAKMGTLSTTIKAGTMAPAGPAYFQILFTGFVVPIFLFVPLYVSGNLISEKSNGTLELIATTTLSEHQIVFGKVASGLGLGLFYLALVVPFFLLAFFMRGIDLVAILATVLMSALMLCGAIYWAMFWTVMRVNKAVKMFFYLIALGGLFLIIGLASAMSVGIMETGAGIFLEGLPWVIFFMTFWVIGVLFAHAISIDQIRTIRWEYQYILDANNRFPPKVIDNTTIPNQPGSTHGA